MKDRHKPYIVGWGAVVAVFLLMPLLITLIYSFADRWVSVLPEGFSLRYYIAALTNREFLMGIVRGLSLSAAVVVFTNIAVLLALYVVLVYLPETERIVQIFCLIPTTINGIIIATSVLSTYAGSGTVLSNRIVMLAFIYCVFVLPVTFQGIRNSLYAVNMKNILEAAEMLGSGRFSSYIKIIIPSILPGMSSSALMSLAGLFGDFSIVKIIASSQWETAQAYLYRNRAADTQELSAAVVILLIITFSINYLVNINMNRTREKRAA